MNVIIRGPLLSVTGYGVHTRQIFVWAKSRGWTIQSSIVPWGICTYYVNPDALDGLIGEIMATSFPGENHDVSFQVQLPDEWDPNLAKFNVGVTAGVEADLCSPEWVAACDKMDRVIVPSTFTKQMFIRSGVAADKISVIPEAHNNQEKISQNLDDQLSALPTSFNLLMFGQLTGDNPENDRKNTFYALKWLAELFKDDPDVGIIVKTNMGRFTTADRQRSANMFEGLVNEVKQGPYPRFYLAHGMLDDVEISTLYKNSTVKALVAPTRGEGWGLPLLDSACAALPVIATNYSGHLDFLKYTKFLQLEYDLVPVHPSRVDGRIWVEGTRWANVREESFKAKLKKFRNADSLPRKWAQDGSIILKEKFSLEAIKKVYDAFWENVIERS